MPAAQGQSSDGPEVEGWTVRLVGIDEKGKRITVRTYRDAFAITLDARDLAAFAGYPLVVAVVNQTDSREIVQAYAPCTLTVNGNVQPGGG